MTSIRFINRLQRLCLCRLNAKNCKINCYWAYWYLWI